MVSSLILFFLGFLYSYFFYKDGQKTHQITAMSDGSLKNNKLAYFYIWNSGKETIYKEDLLNDSKCLEISLESDDVFEYAKITDMTSNYFKLDVYHESKRIKIDFDLIRPDEGFTLMLISPQRSTTYWELPIRQKKSVLVFPDTIKARGTESNLNLLNNLLHFFFLCFVVYSAIFIQRFDFTNLKTSTDYIKAASYCIYLVMIIAATPTMIRRIKAPRPPIELKLHFVERNREEQKLVNVFKNTIRFIARKTGRRKR